MVEAFGLDMNGTLFDDEPVSFRAFGTVLGGLGLPFNKRIYKKYFAGKTSRIGMHDYLVARGFEGLYDEALLLAEADAVYEEIVGKIKPVPGVVEFVGRAALRGVKLAVLTSATRREADHLLGSNPEVGSLIDIVVTGGDVTNPKPDPECLRLASERLGVPLDRWIIVGDSPIDIALAESEDLPSLAVTNTHTQRQLSAATRVVDALSAELADELVGAY